MATVERLRDQLENENDYLRREVTTLQGSSLLVGASTALRRALDAASQVAPTAATVLLVGETGTGKELFASQIHDLSPRRNRPMVRVNCSAIPSALIESELFGREKGAYTGALSSQAGRFEVADKSTLFLDEIGDLPLEMQVKLLRVLQERQIERLGSSKPINVDVRIVAATNRDLEKGIAQGTFREDLYYRLNVFPIRVPPLRERPDDIPMLVWSFVDEFSKAFGKPIESVSKDSMLALQRYPWPGNVRELRNVVERAVIVATGPRLTIDLPKPSADRRVRAPSIALVDIERDHIVAVLDRVKWRVRGDGGAAELLGMKPSTLESRMAKLKIRRPRALGGPVHHVDAAVTRARRRAPPAVTHSERRSHVIGRQVLPGRRHLIAVAEREVVGRHDLHAGLVEALLDVRVQGRVGARQRKGRAHERIDLVADGKVVQRGLEHERRRIREHPFRPPGRRDQQLVDFPPRGVVADRHRRVGDEPAFGGQRRVVEHLRRQDQRIGDGHHDVLVRSHMRHQQALDRHLAERLADAHDVADPEGPRIGEDRARDDVRERGAGGERDEQAQKERDPLECGRLRARNIREGANEGDGQQQRPHQLVGGFGPVVRKRGEADIADLDLLEDDADDSQHQEGGEGDDGKVEEDSARSRASRARAS